MSEAGEILGEKYRLVEQIGAGGMATVWRAMNTALDRPVAVKFISSFSPNQRERFLREAKVAASIRHRNVVDILDFGVTDSGEAYMVLEFMQGESLADRMARPPPMNLGEIVNVAVLTLSGLSAVHSAGVVHRDVKPENVFLVEDEDGWYPKLLDFGVSKSAQNESRDSRGAPLTQEGMLVGTPQYMAPEQARGLRDVDARADLWSVGVMLYELLTGDLPFDSENVGDVLLAVMSKEVLPVHEVRPEVGPELSLVVATAMERDRDKRFQSAKEMRAAILDAAGKMGDAAGMWGRITPGTSGVHDEHMTPISGLIQIAAVEAARASVAAMERARDGESTGVSGVSARPADPMAITMAATPRVASTPPVVREAATPLPSLPGEGVQPKGGGGALWLFVLVIVIAGGVAGAYVWNPELFAPVLAAIGGGADDAGAGDADDAGADDAGGAGVATAPDLGRAGRRDLGHDSGAAGRADAAAGPTGDEGGVENIADAGEDLGGEADDTGDGPPGGGSKIRRPIKRRPIKRRVWHPRHR